MNFGFAKSAPAATGGAAPPPAAATAAAAPAAPVPAFGAAGGTNPLVSTTAAAPAAAALSFGAPKPAGGPLGALGTSTAAAAPIAAPKFPVDHSTVAAALRDGWIEDGLATLIKTHLAAPLKRPVAAAPAAPGLGTAAQPAFEAAALDRSSNDLACLFGLFTASVDAVEGLAPLLASISGSVVANMAQYVSVIPPAPTTAPRFHHRTPAEEKIQHQLHQISLCAAELLVLVLRQWQITEQSLKELLAAVTIRVTDAAQNGASWRGGAAAAIARDNSGAHASTISYLVVTALVASLNVWTPLRRGATGEIGGGNVLCKKGTPVMRSLVEWLERLQRDLKPPSADEPAAAAPRLLSQSSASATGGRKMHRVGGGLLSLCALAVGCFVFQAEDDIGLDISLAAVQNHTKAPRAPGLSTAARRPGHLQTATRSGIQGSSAANQTTIAATAYGGVDQIVGYGKAFKHVVTLMPEAEVLTIPKAILCDTMLHMIKFIVTHMGALIHHLAELDAAAYRAFGAYAAHVAKASSSALSNQSNESDFALPYYQHQSAQQVAPQIPKFHVPQLLSCIGALLDELPLGSHVDDPSPFSDDGDDLEHFPDLAEPTASSIQHLLVHNMPLHFRQIFDVRKNITVGSINASLDAPCYKHLGAYFACLGRIMRVDPETAINVLTLLSNQVECAELRPEAAAELMRECAGLAPLRHAIMSSAVGFASTTAVSVEKNSMLASLVAATNIRQLSPTYLDKQRAAALSGVARFFTELAAWQRPHWLSIDSLFELMTSPEIQQGSAGDVLALIAGMATTSADVSLCLKLLDEYGLLNLPALRLRNAAPTANNGSKSDPARLLRGTAAAPVLDASAAGVDLAAAFVHEQRSGDYAVTIGFLRLVNAIVAYPIPAEAVPMVELVSHTIFSGLSRRAFALERQKHIVGAISTCILERLLRAESWTDGIVRYTSVMAPAQAPSDVLGDCVAVIMEAAHDVHHRQNTLTPLRLVCLRQALRLIATTLATPQRAPWLSMVQSYQQSGLGRATTADGDGDASNDCGRETNHSHWHESFAVVARTRESSDFAAALIRLVLLDDAVGASVALELSAAILPPSTASVLRDLKQADSAAPRQVLDAFVRIFASNELFTPVMLPCDVRHVNGLIGSRSVDPEFSTNDDIACAAAAIRLRHAAIDVVIRSAASKTPALALWLCGYSTGHAIASEARQTVMALPAWVRSAAGMTDGAAGAVSTPLEADHILDPILVALSDGEFGDSNVLLSAKYTKLLAVLVTNSATNTSELRHYLRMRDGLDFLGSAFTTMGVPLEMAAAQERSGAELFGDPSGPAAVYRTAFSLKLLLHQFFAGAQRVGLADCMSSDAAAEQDFILKNLTWLLATPANSVLPEAIAAVLGSDHVDCVLGRWLVSALTVAPVFPKLQAVTTPTGVDVGAMCLVALKPLSDLMGAGPAEDTVPQYDITAIYRVLSEMNVAAADGDLREVLSTFVEANKCLRAHFMISAFIDSWADLVELLCACYPAHLSVTVLCSLARLLYSVAECVRTVAVFTPVIENRIVEAVFRALIAVLGCLDRNLNQASKVEFNVNVVADLSVRGIRAILRHVNTASTSSIMRVHVYASLLSVLRAASKAGVPVDDAEVLVTADRLFAQLSADATVGHPTTRIMALRVLQALTDRRDAVIEAMVGTGRRHAVGAPPALRAFVTAAVAALNEAVAAALAPSATLDDPMYATDWIEGVFAVLGSISQSQPQALQAADLVAQLTEAAAWGPLTAALLAETSAAASAMWGASGTVVGGFSAAASGRGGLTPAQGALSLRAFAAATSVIGSMVLALPHHVSLPLEAANFVQATMQIFVRVLSAPFLDIAFASAKTAAGGGSHSDNPYLRTATCASFFLMTVSRTAVVKSMPPLCAALSLVPFYDAALSGVATLLEIDTAPAAETTPPPEGGAAGSPSGLQRRSMIPTIRPQLRDALSHLGSLIARVAVTLLNVVSPVPNDGTPRDETRDGYPALESLASTPAAGREAMVSALAMHARILSHLSIAAGVTQHASLLKSLTASAQAAAFMLNMDIRRRHATAARGDVSPTHRTLIRDATNALVTSTAAVVRRLTFAAEEGPQASSNTTNDTFLERSDATGVGSASVTLADEQSVFVGHHCGYETAANDSAAAARATQVILGSLLSAATGGDARGNASTIARRSRLLQDSILRPAAATAAAGGHR